VSLALEVQRVFAIDPMFRPYGLLGVGAAFASVTPESDDWDDWDPWDESDGEVEQGHTERRAFGRIGAGIEIGRADGFSMQMQAGPRALCPGSLGPRGHSSWRAAQHRSSPRPLSADTTAGAREQQVRSAEDAAFETERADASAGFVARRECVALDAEAGVAALGVLSLWGLRLALLGQCSRNRRAFYVRPNTSWSPPCSETWQVP
jgi:hypothetical protein